MSAVYRVIRAAARAHRLPTVVVALVVLASTATCVIGIALLAAADAPFDRSFARQHGAHAVVSFDASKASVSAIALTAHGVDVADAGGPYPQVTAQLTAGGEALPIATIAGRDTPNGPVDKLSVDTGRWPQRMGEIAISTDFVGRYTIGEQLTTGVAGAPTLTVVGIARSITQTADGWVTQQQAAALQPTGASTVQMLYRFHSAATDTAVRSSIRQTVAALPRAAVLGSSSYLAVRLDIQQTAATATPFVTAFAILGIVISALIVSNVVSGAVIAGYRKIGVLKALGFSPAQVVTVFAGRALVPTVVGCAGGAALGVALAWPILNQQGDAYHVAAVGVPPWAVATSVGGMLVIVIAAAAVPALRAARISATQALSVGRTPRSGHGQLGRRVFAASRLPRPLALGMAAPLVRPGRSVATAITLLLGTSSLVFAVGLTTSLTRVAGGLTRAGAVPVRVDLPVAGNPVGKTPLGATLAGSAPMTSDAVSSLLRSVAGTRAVVGVRETTVSVVGASRSVDVTGYDGLSSWVGYPLINGRWFSGPDEAVVPTYVLHLAETHVGGTITLDSGIHRETLRVVGEVFDLDNAGLAVITSAAAVQTLQPASVIDHFEVGLLPHTNVNSYLARVDQRLPRTSGFAWSQGSHDNTIDLFLILIKIMMLLIGSVVALGVFNATLLTTRDQVRDIGILKSVGMAPAQIATMILTSLVLLGLATAMVAVPIGLWLHGQVLHDMAHVAATGLPARYLSVYSAPGLVGIAVIATIVACAGALVPATWAARARAASALRAE